MTPTHGGGLIHTMAIMAIAILGTGPGTVPTIHGTTILGTALTTPGIMIPGTGPTTAPTGTTITTIRTIIITPAITTAAVITTRTITTTAEQAVPRSKAVTIPPAGEWAAPAALWAA